MRIRLSLAIVALLLTGWSATAVIPPATSAQKVAEQVCAAPPLASSAVGVFAMRMDGDTIASVNPRVKLVPASNMKLLTTGMALRELGADFRFETKIAYSGAVKDSVLVGDLYIVGGGDPTTGANVPCAEQLTSLFSQWLRIVRSAGIKSVRGRIVADARYFDLTTPEGLGWTYDDLGTNYGAGPTGLNFFENAQNFLIVPGSSVGDAPVITPRYPQTPWMTFVNHARTSPARSANTVYYINTHLSPVGEFGGNFPIDRKGYTFEGSNRFGAYTLAWYFLDYLKGKNFSVDGGCADIDARGRLRLSAGEITPPDAESAAKQDALVVIGSTYSHSLASIAAETNFESDNFFAETLLKTVSRHRGRGSDYDSAMAAAVDVLADMGLNAAYGCRIFDGSGLSRKNYVSPSFFVSFLRAMASSDVRDAYLRSLPRPGGRGTLEYKFPKASASLRSRIRMKSGSMNGVLCYSGYILSSDGDPSHDISFSILTNNVTASTWVTAPQVDKIIEALAAEN